LKSRVGRGHRRKIGNELSCQKAESTERVDQHGTPQTLVPLHRLDAIVRTDRTLHVLGER
jgi:hypothetical protein